MEVESIEWLAELALTSFREGDHDLAEACICLFAIRGAGKGEGGALSQPKELPGALLEVARQIVMPREEDGPVTDVLNKQYARPDRNAAQAAGADAFLIGFIEGRKGEEPSSDSADYRQGYELAKQE